ncbi:hypothetical protein [Pseudomonas sp. GD03944]|uniref:hypothetical protein n=1 Tax=Pseudomonas sp. GD03944 TaxID=2975409 RepID=UPI00244845AD|nr:hypothetical protein [Pseudomonas sp. GD03944]MDH1261400.1 hypothetical protein [Pseudomonas sp. GD03944]
MHRLTIKYARNGALAGIGLYLMIAIPLLTLSMSMSYTAAPRTQTASMPTPAVQHITQVAMALLQS